MMKRVTDVLWELGRVALASLLLLGSAACSAVENGERLETPTVSEQPVADPFQRLRRATVSPGPDYWERVGAALQELATIEGAAYNEEYGVLTLHGKPADGQGPFHLDDLMVALRAAFFERKTLGMTMDPFPDDPHGPKMKVVFFAGCEDTAFGWVLFECDRVLKSLTRGEDSITRKPVRPTNLDDFHNMMELSRAFGEGGSNRWNRFWLTLDLGNGPPWTENPTQSNGYQPVLRRTRDGTAIDFLHCRLYLRTEPMELKNGEMVSVKGGKSKSSLQFANHFTYHFDVFAEQYPVFRRAESLARLAVVAEWLRWLEENRGITLDKEFIRAYRQRVLAQTPKTTPAGTSYLNWDERRPDGIVHCTQPLYGGVELPTRRTFFADDTNGAAGRQQKLGREGASTHRRALSWDFKTPEGETRKAAVIPTSRTRLMPSTKPIQRTVAFHRRGGRETSQPSGNGSADDAIAARVGHSGRVADSGISLNKTDSTPGRRDQAPVVPGPQEVLPPSTTSPRPRPGRSDKVADHGVSLTNPDNKSKPTSRGPPAKTTNDSLLLSPAVSVQAPARTSTIAESQVSLKQIDTVRRQRARAPPTGQAVAPNTGQLPVSMGRAQPAAGVDLPLTAAPGQKGEPARGPPPAGMEESSGVAQPQPGLGRAERIAPPKVPLNSAEPGNPALARGPPVNSAGSLTLGGRTESIADPGVALSGRPTQATVPELRVRPTEDPSPARPSLPPDTPLGLTAFFPATGGQTYDLPRLVEPPPRLHYRNVQIDGKPETRMRVVDGLRLTSDLGDVFVEFGEPKIDQKRAQFFYPPSSPGIEGLIGFYPHIRTLEFDDGTAIRFGDDGNPERVTVPGGVQLEFQYSSRDAGIPGRQSSSCRVTSSQEHTASGSYKLNLWDGE